MKFKIIEHVKSLFSRSAAAAPAPAPADSSPDVPPGFIKRGGVLIETDDPMQADAIALVLRTGKPVVGYRNRDGSHSIKKLDS